MQGEAITVHLNFNFFAPAGQAWVPLACPQALPPLLPALAFLEYRTRRRKPSH